MRDITSKPPTLRQARAQAWVRMPAECVQRVRDGTIDKGDVREAARIAALMGIKRCWELLPHCHPLPLQHSAVNFELSESGVRIETEVATIGPTGVEMEALTGASIAALTIYDMLKPHAGMNLSIEDTRLLEKTGGKSDHRRQLKQATGAAIITVSTAVARGDKPDAAGDWLAQALTDAGFAPLQRLRVPADPQAIRTALDQALAGDAALVLTVGGTGLTPDDCCVSTIEPLLDTPIPGIMETARQFGQQRTPLALVSRGVAGQIDQSLVITLPGSRGGVADSWHAIVAGVVHVIGGLRRDS